MVRLGRCSVGIWQTAKDRTFCTCELNVQYSFYFATRDSPPTQSRFNGGNKFGHISLTTAWSSLRILVQPGWMSLICQPMLRSDQHTKNRCCHGLTRWADAHSETCKLWICRVQIGKTTFDTMYLFNKCTTISPPIKVVWIYLQEEKVGPYARKVKCKYSKIMKIMRWQGSNDF